MIATSGSGLISAFEWMSFPSGYRITKTKPSRLVPIASPALDWMNEPADYIVPVNPAERRERTCPFARDLVVEEFSRIKCTEDVKRFVSRFGMLWHTTSLVVVVRDKYANPFFWKRPARRR